MSRVVFTDTHCHLDFPDFQEDLGDLIERARDAGVQRLISIGISVESSRQVVELAKRHPSVYATVGIHPCEADSVTREDIEMLTPLLENPKVVAIGECGLDYHHLPERPSGASDDDYDSLLKKWKTHQKEIFDAQLELAARHGLNVVIHQRNSWDDVMDCLQPYQGRLKAVLHCFGENPERAQEAINAGHSLSFTGIATFKNAHEVRAAAACIPGDRLMLETDAPYLAPHPHRGKRNESSYVPLIAQTIAGVRNLTVDELARQTESNTNHFFRFP
jgi:TatD DNase family protein